MQTSSLKLWRLSNYDDLSGRGGLAASGRWHNRGRAIVYCSESAELAMTEIELGLGLPKYLWPDTYKLLRVAVPARTIVETLADHDLPENWRDDTVTTRRLGDRWLRDITAPLLRVPSARAAGSNYLINPAHIQSDALKVERTYDMPAILRAAFTQD